MVQFEIGLLSDPSVVGGILGDALDLRRFAVAGVLWMLVFWLLDNLIKFVLVNDLGSRIGYNQLNSEQRESFCMWVLELFVSTIALAVVVSYGGHVILHGTFTKIIVDDTPEPEWGHELSWVAEVRHVSQAWAYGAQPMLFLYLYEIVSASAVRQTRSQQHLITGHHLMCALLLTFGAKAASDTLNPLWVRMGLVCLLHMICEQQTWIALIMYRLRIPGYRAVVVAATAAEIICRLVLWSCCFYVYSQLCWLACTYTSFEVVWRYVFPPTALFLMCAQCLTIRIHIQLAIKALQQTVQVTNTRQAARLQSTSRMQLTALPGISLAAAVVCVIGILFGVEVIPMNATVVEVNCKNIAVVGGGVTGIAATFALALSGDFNVDLIESRTRFGGAAYSNIVDGIAVEHAFSAMLSYHNFDNFLRSLNVDISLRSAGASAVVEHHSGERMFYGNSVAGQEGGNYVDFTAEITRLNALKLQYQYSLSEEELMTTSLLDFTFAHNFSDRFRFLYLTACIQSYGAVSTNALDIPLANFFWVEDWANSCLTFSRTSYRCITSGSSTYVDKIVSRFAANPRINLMPSTKAVAIKHSSSGTSLLVQHADGTEHWKEYDHVIFANIREDVARILYDPRSSSLPAPNVYSSVLGNTNSQTPVSYQTFNTVVHMDVPFAEKRLSGLKTSEGCWRFERYTYLGKLGPNLTRPIDFSSMLFPNSVSHIDNCVRNLSGPFRLGVRNDVPPDLNPNKILFHESWRPVVTDVSFWKSLRSIHAIQGLNRMWYAGGTVVANLHETAFTSGLVIAEALGARYPFENDGAARIFFIRVRNWLRYGLQYMTGPSVTVKRGSSLCARCT